MEALWKDIKHSIRMLGKNPWFAALAIVTLALGMAVNTTIFSVVNAMLFRPLPVWNPNELTVLALQQAGDPSLQNLSYPDFEDVRNQADSFSDVFGYRVSLVGLAFEGKGDHCIVSRVSSNYFSALGIKPAVGRLLLPTEGRTPGADPVLVLGYSYWQKRFGGDKEIVGKQVDVNGHPLTVVGVAPKDFHGTNAMINMDAYFPLSARVNEEGSATPEQIWTQRDQRNMAVMGRLKPGVSLKQARASLGIVAQRIAAAHPDIEKGIALQVYPEKLSRPEPDPDNTLPAASAAFMLLAGLVLLVACFNIANVLLVRATVRQREMAIRSALGAGRGRLIRQSMTESLLLAVFGGGAGVLLASWATDFLSSLSLGTDLPLVFNFHPDVRVYLFAVAAVLFTGITVGIIPALRVARTDVSSVLHEGGRGSSDGPRRLFARNSLVVAQVAGSVLLLIVAGLFVRSLHKAQQIDLGFDPDHVLNLSTDVQQISYPEAQGRAFYRDLDTRIRTLPGVVSTTQAFTVPMGVIGADAPVIVEGRAVEPGQQPPDVYYNMVTPQYFETLQIPLLRGRTFTDSDKAKGPMVAVINQTMAKKFWPGQDVLGRRFSIKGPTGPFIEVIGVVRDHRVKSLTEDPKPFFYLSLEQNYSPLRTIQVRTSVPPDTLAPQIESEMQSLAPGLPINRVETMSQSLEGVNGLLLFRVGVKLTATMGLLGLVLAVVGVYSVVAYSASQRTHEIGIRMTLGAGPRQILEMILRQGLITVGIGLVLGLSASFAGTRLLADLFLGVSAKDPLTFASVAILLAAVALLACWIPAYRATRVDPLVALRYE